MADIKQITLGNTTYSIKDAQARTDIANLGQVAHFGYEAESPYPDLDDTDYTDTTLTVSGQAADAKVVGDELTELKSEFDEVMGLNKLLQSSLTYTGQANLTKNVYGDVYLENGFTYVFRYWETNAFVNLPSSKGTIEDSNSTTLLTIMSYTTVGPTGVQFTWTGTTGWYVLHVISASGFNKNPSIIANGLMVYKNTETVTTYSAGAISLYAKNAVSAEMSDDSYRINGLTLNAEWEKAPLNARVFGSVTVYLNTWNSAGVAHTTTFGQGTKLPMSSITSLGTVTASSGMVCFLKETINYTEDDFGVLVYTANDTSDQVFFYLDEITSWGATYNYLMGAGQLRKGWNYIALSNKNIVNTSNFDRLIVKFDTADVSLSMLQGIKLSLVQGIGAIIKYAKTKSDYSLIAYGDSLTSGVGSSGFGYRYIDVLRSELRATRAEAFGYGGSGTKAIAFTAGAISAYVPPNVTSFSLKYADLTSNVTIVNNQLSGKTVIINGNEYTISQSGETAYSLPNTYTPSGLYLPVTVKNSTYTANIYIIWAGTNDGSLQYDLIDTMISKLPTEQYIVMGLTRLGTDTTVEDELKAYQKYGSHFFNTRIQIINNAFTVLGETPTSADTTAMASGLMPPSLLYDSTHFNDDGYEAIGKLLAIHVKSLGYDYR